MKYMQVFWDHQFPDEPVAIYHEIDDARVEHRKVEQFADGTYGFADGRKSRGSTRLAIVTIPSMKEIGSQSEFRPSEITKEEFEAIWNAATTG